MLHSQNVPENGLGSLGNGPSDPAGATLNSFGPALRDSILGLAEVFRADPRQYKIGLLAGMFYAEPGVIYLPEAVAQAERVVFNRYQNGRIPNLHGYLDLAGLAEFRGQAQKLLFGHESELLRSESLATIQTAGGSFALCLGAALVRKVNPEAKVFLSDPYWDNYIGIFNFAGLGIEPYPYYDPVGDKVDFDRMVVALENAPAGSIFVLQACGHNPTGQDLSRDQWRSLSELFLRRSDLIPFIDLAYQGLVAGLDEDAYPARLFASKGVQFLVAQSFSKNAGLYSDRIGTLSVVSENANNIFGHLKNLIRNSYSNSPAPGARIVAELLANPDLFGSWSAELQVMREILWKVRHDFAAEMSARGFVDQFGYISAARGLYSLLKCDLATILRLREEHAVYILESGRINIAALKPQDMERFCNALDSVWPKQ